VDGTSLYQDIETVLPEQKVIVGLENAGKTTVLWQFSMNEVIQAFMTIGSHVEEIVIS
jgi:GTPase SAR1 family protein